jgi:hypothetical protein
MVILSDSERRTTNRADVPARSKFSLPKRFLLDKEPFPSSILAEESFHGQSEVSFELASSSRRRLVGLNRA